MMGLRLPKAPADLVKILCLGAHSDDIEIGCGGTLLQLRKTYKNIAFCWVVFSASGVRREEARRGAELFAGDTEKQTILKEFRDGFLPYTGGAVKEVFEELKSHINPDIIFTHWQGDAHQDHRLISELTKNTFRDHWILEYEVPKYDGDLGRPAVFVPLDSPLHEHKINHLFGAFQSQQSKPWFDRETFRGLMRLRGMECNSASGYAEAFYTQKIVLRDAK
jgi:LmbE family N-acetylglucosaminyl deacetylase